jgi:hypothetical protein
MLIAKPDGKNQGQEKADQPQPGKEYIEESQGKI